MKYYTLYIVNSLHGTYREMNIRAKNSEHARSLFDGLCKKENEILMSVFPVYYT